MDDMQVKRPGRGKRVRGPDNRRRAAPEVMARLPPAEQQGWARLCAVFGVKSLAVRVALVRFGRELAQAEARGERPEEAFADDLAAVERATRSA